MDIENIRNEIKDKFGSNERAAEIIEQLFDGILTKEEALKEECFIFESGVDAKMIMNLLNVTEYEEVMVGDHKMISMNNIRDAATVYYTLTHLEQLAIKDVRICAWCKKPIGVFKDQMSEKEFKISGACQTCQNSIWE